MRKHIKVARFQGMSGVSGSIPVLGLCFPGGVKVARFPGMSEFSGSIPVSGLCFLLIVDVFTLCLPCYSPLLSACRVIHEKTVKRGAPSTASCLTHS